MQGDIAFQRWRQRQAAGDAELITYSRRAVQQADVMQRAHGHANLTPQILKKDQRRWNPEIGKSEVFLGLKIECGTVRKLLDGAYPRSEERRVGKEGRYRWWE